MDEALLILIGVGSVHYRLNMEILNEAILILIGVGSVHYRLNMEIIE